MVSSLSRDYPFGASGGSLIDVGAGYGKGWVGPRTTNPPPMKLIVGLMVVILCHIIVDITHS